MKQTNNEGAETTVANTANNAANENTNDQNKTSGTESKNTDDNKKAAANKNTGEKKNDNSNNANKKDEPSPLEKFFCSQLKDIYYVEHQLLQALPKMEQAATTEQLKEAFNDHTHQTQKHVKRLEKIFAILGKQPEEQKCEVIDALIKAGDKIISETEQGSLTRDAALIIAAQKVEHYEIATYGGLVQLALTLDHEQAADILDSTLMEEEDTDELLTEIAENDVNINAEDEDLEITETSVYTWR